MVEIAERNEQVVPTSEGLHDDRSLQSPAKISDKALSLMGLSSIDQFSDPYALGRVVEQADGVEEIDGIPHNKRTFIGEEIYGVTPTVTIYDVKVQGLWGKNPNRMFTKRIRLEGESGGDQVVVELTHFNERVASGIWEPMHHIDLRKNGVSASSGGSLSLEGEVYESNLSGQDRQDIVNAIFGPRVEPYDIPEPSPIDSE